MPGLRDKIIIEMTDLIMRMGLVNTLTRESVTLFGEQAVCNDPRFQEIMVSLATSSKAFNKGTGISLEKIRKWIRNEVALTTVQRTIMDLEEIKLRLQLLDMFGETSLNALGAIAIVKDQQANEISIELAHLCYPFTKSLDGTIKDLKTWIDEKLISLNP